MTVELMTRVSPLVRALATPSQETLFSQRPFRRAKEPGTEIVDVLNGLEPGVFKVGNDGASGASGNKIEFTPYAKGPPGSWFWMRVVGWRRLGNDPGTSIWGGSVLAEFLCVAGAIAGPPRIPGRVAGDRTKVPRRLVDDDENACDEVYLNRGSLGTGIHAGQIVQFGRGSGIPAIVEMPLRGHGLFQFDFAVPQELNVAANALWAWA